MSQKTLSQPAVHSQKTPSGEGVLIIISPRWLTTGWQGRRQQQACKLVNKLAFTPGTADSSVVDGGATRSGPDPGPGMTVRSGRVISQLG